ncbi:MAG: aldo/keto reductase [Candidatus Eremiobacteraeota bacterium]|nr:aldo/keto reductase [Candidatus Eremiobacteraeota bacterium]
MDRRDFITEACKSVVGAGIVAGLCSDPRFLAGITAGSIGESGAKPAPVKKEVIFRAFGKTGLKVSEVGFGAMITNDSSVLAQALEMGINYIDTAARYQGGNNEKMIGNLLGKKRKNVIICTKVPPGRIDEMERTVEQSLVSLKTDYLDLLLLHALKSEEEVQNREWQQFLAKLKKQGKTRFVGVSTHSNMAGVLKAVTKSKFYDAVLTTYNFKVGQDVKEAVAEARKAGVATIAMKIMCGGYQAGASSKLNPFQAALRWVLNDKNIDTTIPSVTSMDQLNQNFDVMGSKMTFSDRKALSRYAHDIAPLHCSSCGSCDGSCTHGVQCTDILRFLMYAEGYREMDLARESYSELHASEKASRCLSCRRCMIKCAHSLDIRSRMREAHRLLA